MLGDSCAYALSERPAHLTGSYKNYTLDDVRWVASQFRIPGSLEVRPFPGRGNINLHTYEVLSEGTPYLLQKVNDDVFTMPYRVMKAMETCLQAQRSSLQSAPVDGWVPIELIPTLDGEPFLDLTDEHGWNVWRLMVRIPESVSYKSLAEVADRPAQLALAEEAGRGLAIYTDLTASIDPANVEGSLPGYRDTALYYRLFYSIMAGNRTLAEAAALIPHDPVVRSSTEKHFMVALSDAEYRERKYDPELAPFISLVVEHEPFGMTLWNALAQGRIRPSLIHGDPKIENFLFCSRTARVKSLVDLDTIMSFTWLNDYGDMIRSLVNVAGERERNLAKVGIDVDVFESVSRGFLQARQDLTDNEFALMVPAIQTATLELGVRFLTDYLRGDTYFQLGPKDDADLNKVRAMVQLALYRHLIEFGPEAERRLAKMRS